ncbi:protease TldD [Methylophilales bacterium MBRSG12]|uniref:Protease TldD n=1 Tax=Methylophilales bacterium MBRS-H7 TaxID=1623450 RepID=A0A0H4JA15_9PROT|nr:protease TldD [Methylophilales bacterium MBRSF5]AKO65332.1 protease TldD [Methylophilales bacterium MBRS-H7]AKO66651.1 protease TldD [Methylophilales bacterium MBRSG12]
MNNEINNLILNPAELDNQKIQKVMNNLNHKNIDYSDLYFQYSKNEFLAIEDGAVKNASFNIDNGCGVRAVSGDKTAYAYTDEVNFQTLTQSCEIINALRSQGQNKSVPQVNSNTPQQLYPSIDPIINTGEKKIEILKKLESLAFSRDKRIIKVSASIAAEYDVILIANKLSDMKSDIRPLVRLSLSIIIEDKNRREIGTAGGGGRYSIDYFTDDVLDLYIDEAYHQAVTNLEAIPSPAGLMPVVLGPGWPGILLHEAIGHGLEGDFNRKGTSAFSKLMGKQVAHSDITIVDDGTIQDRRGSLNIDDEGNPTQRTVLIENGILKNYLQDTLNAKLMNMEITGNGRRESYAHIPMPRMTNTIMTNGKYNPDEIIKSVKKGIYAPNFGGGQVDITSGKFVFSSSLAWLIEDGKITQPIKGASIVGNGPDILKKVSMVGNDSSLDTGVGTCGKDGQSVPVGVGQPTLKIDEILVGGSDTQG